MGSCLLTGLQDGGQLCPCYSRLMAKTPVEGQASSVGVMSRKDVPLALAVPSLGHHVCVRSEIPYRAPLPRIIVGAGSLERSDRDSMLGQ